MEISKLYEDVLGQFNVPNKVDSVATYILCDEGATSSVNTMSARDIITRYKDLVTKDNNIVSINENSFASYLSLLSHDSKSSILCDGRKQGYYVKFPDDNAIETIEEAGSLNVLSNISDGISNEKGSEGSKGVCEKDLYDYFKNWLRTKGYYASDKSSSRALGKWQNTDIVGIKDIYILDLPHIEIAAVEVKKSKDIWMRDIFEAVAHKMFAHRVYFGFMCSENEVDKIGDMQKYAERFKIGILALIVPEDSNIDKKQLQSSYIREIVPAPYDAPSFEMQKIFLEEVMSVYTREQLNNLKDSNSTLHRDSK